jgi:uncharacterized membrane protein
MIWPGNREIDQLRERVNSAYVLGSQRSAGQDIEFAFSQLVEVAVRALSPGLIDPFTAITCIDHLGSALCRLAARDQPSPYLYDKQDQLRVIAPSVSFPAITDLAFNQIRQYGCSSTAVMRRLLETIAVVSGFVHRPEDSAALMRHAEMIVRAARNGLAEAEDRRMVEECFQTTVPLGSESGRDNP